MHDHPSPSPVDLQPVPISREVPSPPKTPGWVWISRGLGLVLWLLVLGLWIQSRISPPKSDLPNSDPDWGPNVVHAAEPGAEKPAPAKDDDGASPSKTKVLLLDPNTLELTPAEEANKHRWSPDGVADFEFTDQLGRTVKKDDLLGRPWIVCFIFTKCLGPCPKVTSQMRKLNDLLKNQPVRFVSMTVDPERDTQEVLKTYADLQGANPERWLFLMGDRDQTYRLIQGSFRMPVHEVVGPNRVPGWEVFHSTNLLLVDEKGVVREKYNAQEDADIPRLCRDVRKLLNPAPSKASSSESPIVVTPDWVLRLPHVNAGLNFAATVLLILGFVLIKQKQIAAHKAIMLTAFAVSCLFLGCYLTYHQALHYYTGNHGKAYTGTGLAQIVYFTILISHVVLAIPVPVLAILTMRCGFQQNWPAHKFWAWITWPIWLYVSITGVVIYLMLY